MFLCLCRWGVGRSCLGMRYLGLRRRRSCLVGFMRFRSREIFRSSPRVRRSIIVCRHRGNHKHRHRIRVLCGMGIREGVWRELMFVLSVRRGGFFRVAICRSRQGICVSNVCGISGSGRTFFCNYAILDCSRGGAGDVSMWVFAADAERGRLGFMGICLPKSRDVCIDIFRWMKLLT